MKTEFKIDVADYLSHDEIKEICKEQVKCEISNYFRNEENAQRLLCNLSYDFVYQEIDKVIPNSKTIIVNKTMEVIQDIKSYKIFRYHYLDGRPQNNGSKIIEDCVVANKELINQKVKETITNKDYTDLIWDKFETLAENFMGNIYEITRLGRSK